MNILVTGGFGFIGHQVASNLQQLGHNVCVVDCAEDYNIMANEELSFLYNQRIHKLTNTKFFKINILDTEKVEKVFCDNKFDIVIHCASAPRQKIVASNPVKYSQSMIQGTINLLELCKNYSIGKFVLISSSMVYGNFKNNTTEDMLCNPINLYGILKYSGELLVKNYSKYFDYTIIRPSAVYGPYDCKDRVIAKYLISAMKNDKLIINGVNEHLDFSYIDDVAKGITNASLSSNTKNKTYNLTRGESVSLVDAANLIIQLVGNGVVEIRDKEKDFPSRGSLSISKARKDFGYDPTINIEQGLKLYYEWIRHTIFRA
jgi:nucleoside-diphosphate-sugar epimerase